MALCESSPCWPPDSVLGRFPFMNFHVSKALQDVTLPASSLSPTYSLRWSHTVLSTLSQKLQAPSGLRASAFAWNSLPQTFPWLAPSCLRSNGTPSKRLSLTPLTGVKIFPTLHSLSVPLSLSFAWSEITFFISWLTCLECLLNIYWAPTLSHHVNGCNLQTKNRADTCPLSVCWEDMNRVQTLREWTLVRCQV